MLNVLSICLSGGDRHACARASRSIERQGFAPAESFEWKGGAIKAWAHPQQAAVENCVVSTPAAFACCAGPLWYRGRFGIAALRLLIEETGSIDETELRGNFALFLGKDQRYLLMNDALGLVRVYVSPDQRFYSTSWLATCAYAGRVELDEQAASEYVLLGASHSYDTEARGITRVPLANFVDLTQGRMYPRLGPSDWIGTTALSSFDEAVEEAEALLREVFQEVAAAFPARVRTALSGGFDSRLIVAGLLASGERPNLFVYGDAQSDDIAIARSVARNVGLPLEIIDKGVLNRKWPAPDIERLVESALFFDGLPSDGIYDPGADQQTRLQQMIGGYIAPNGGGGEIFRNFFHLPDRQLYPIDIVRTFYRGFDLRVFRRRRALAAYQERMVASIESVLGIARPAAGRKLRREEVESLYPLFRCHHWMSVNNSVATRHGYYNTPLVDLNTVRFACRLPLTWKNAGKLESRLIERLHHGVADHPSSYGFRFTDGPNQSARLTEWANCMRPVFARPLVSAARRSLHTTRPLGQMIHRCRSLLPGEWHLDSALDLDRLPDTAAFSRALAVEIAWRKLTP
jgi:asparagine synthase (glutamine-hydrolysing)